MAFSAAPPDSKGELNPVVGSDLVKRYGDLVAVDHVDLAARAGTCLGVLGPNGAGKTTTIEMLEGILPADQGQIRILGQTWAQDSRELRQNVGVQLQESRLPEKLSVVEILRTFRSFYRRGRSVHDVLELVGLQEKARTRTVHLSGGQRQRLALGCALVGDPRVLFLDEPTTGLDPQARRRVWEIVEDFKHGGGTVILTTHYMEEAERLADDLLILDHGRVIARGSPTAIIESLRAESFLRLSVEGQVVLERLTALPGVLEVRREGMELELAVERTQGVLPDLLSEVKAQGLHLVDLHIHRPNLEDVFVALTGRHLRDE